jgi:hypothetical protein
LACDLASSGKVSTLEEAIAALHEVSFENYNQWALMVHAKPVYSARLAERKLHDSTLRGKNTAAAAAFAAASAPPQAVTGDGDGSQIDTPPATDGQDADEPTNVPAADDESGAAVAEDTKSPLPDDNGKQSKAKKKKKGRKKHSSAASTGSSSGGAGGADVLGAKLDAMHGAPDAASTDIPADFAAGAESDTRLFELCLLYCLRMELANLRFVPE